MEKFNCFRIEKNKPSNKKEKIIPKEVIIKLNLTSLLSVFRTDRSFIERTGNTHGIKFKIRPPTIDTNKIKYKELFDCKL